MNPLRAWWESRAEASDYTTMRIAEAYQQVTGKLGVRGSAAYIGALNLISDAVSIAEVEGEFSESLKPHLGAIARGLVDCGESVFEIQLSRRGQGEFVARVDRVCERRFKPSRLELFAGAKRTV